MVILLTTPIHLLDKSKVFTRYEESVIEPLKYYEALPSKGIRIKMANVFNHWFQVDKEKLDRICHIMHKLHNASLVIDDIEDSSEKRRGVLCAHLKYGIPLSLNAANYGYFQALQEILEDETLTSPKRLRAVELFVEAMLLMHLGQGMEIYWRDQVLNDTPTLESVPTEKEYLDVIVKKTSHQFVLLSESMKIRSSTVYATSKERMDVGHLAGLIGAHFQIRDDLLNLVSDKYEEGKGFCEDISEGKYSFPIIHGLNLMGRGETAQKGKAFRLLEILRMRTTDRTLKEEAFHILEESGALEYTKKVLQEYEVAIAKELLRLGGNPVALEMGNLFGENV